MYEACEHVFMYRSHACQSNISRNEKQTFLILFFVSVCFTLDVHELSSDPHVSLGLTFGELLTDLSGI